MRRMSHGSDPFQTGPHTRLPVHLLERDFEEDEEHLPSVSVKLRERGSSNFYVTGEQRLVDGLFVPTRAPLAPGQRLRVEVVLPSGLRFRCVAFVEWLRGGSGRRPPGMGVRLSDLGYVERRMIALYVRRRAPMLID